MEYKADFYDKMYKKGGYQGVYDLPVKRSYYYPLFKVILKKIRKLPLSLPRILEVGAGTGGLAEMILRHGYSYKGFDFSSVAIENAVRRTGRSDCFVVADAYEQSSYIDDYNTIICTEVLEHAEEDLRIIKQWQKDSFCICSVPNFDSESHVRFFRTEDEVFKRYSSAIHIEKIYKIKKPILADLSLANYLRHIVWQRYKPCSILKILGFGNFDDVGGWFIFIGRKR
ncbi:MAG: class I SAM-dependent methyltransferase [Candidatus Brocadiaceae bacterium]|nr:class I SAM-dependent methyltransferase [Candidatus Brocadiaceae bacterium]